jgi:hypothetical protein
VTTAPTDSAPRQHDQDKSSSFAIPLIVWLLIQLAAIALAASGVVLSARFPKPPQSLAVHEMLVAQFIGSAMFFSVLFRGGWRGWLAMVVAAAPMLMGAAWLARMPLSRVPGLWVHVGAWLAMLALWSAVGMDRGSRSRAMHSPALGSVLTAAAMLLSAGGLLVWYLQSEFQPNHDLVPIRILPLPALLQSLTTSSASFVVLPLLSTATLVLVAAVILAAKASRRRANQRLTEG